MKTKTKIALITLPIAVVAFILSPILFPPADVGVAPTSTQLPFLMFLGVSDAVLLGLGASLSWSSAIPSLQKSPRTRSCGLGRCTCPSGT